MKFPKWKSSRGEIVKAVVVLKPGKTLSAEELTAYCRHSLANYKVPRATECIDTPRDLGVSHERCLFSVHVGGE